MPMYISNALYTDNNDDHRQNYRTHTNIYKYNLTILLNMSRRINAVIMLSQDFRQHPCKLGKLEMMESFQDWRKILDRNP